MLDLLLCKQVKASYKLSPDLKKPARKPRAKTAAAKKPAAPEAAPAEEEAPAEPNPAAAKVAWVRELTYCVQLGRAALPVQRLLLLQWLLCIAKI